MRRGPERDRGTSCRDVLGHVRTAAAAARRARLGASSHDKAVAATGGLDSARTRMRKTAATFGDAAAPVHARRRRCAGPQSARSDSERSGRNVAIGRSAAAERRAACARSRRCERRCSTTASPATSRTRPRSGRSPLPASRTSAATCTTSSTLHAGAYDTLGLLLFVPRQHRRHQDARGARARQQRQRDRPRRRCEQRPAGERAALPPQLGRPGWPVGRRRRRPRAVGEHARRTCRRTSRCRSPADPALRSSRSRDADGHRPSARRTQVEQASPRRAISSPRSASCRPPRSAAHDWDQQQIDRDHQHPDERRRSGQQRPRPARPGFALPHRRRVLRPPSGRTARLGLGGRRRKARRSGSAPTRSPPDPADSTQLVFTDTPDAAPVRLDPWTMMTMPDDNEKGWFGRENLRIVFNTHDVDRFFGAYGKELRLRLEAANGEHPQGTGSNPAPAADRRHERAADRRDAAVAVGAGARRCDRTRRAVAASTVDETRVQHSEVEFDIPLHPFMEYLLDVELRRPGRRSDRSWAAGVPSPLHHRWLRHARRIGLVGGRTRTTSQSAPPDTFATMLATLGARPQGAPSTTISSATRSSRCGVPDQPQVVVFWQQVGAADPQPAAIMIDATEPLSRSRNYPRRSPTRRARRAEALDPRAPRVADVARRRRPRCGRRHRVRRPATSVRSSSSDPNAARQARHRRPRLARHA